MKALLYRNGCIWSWGGESAHLRANSAGLETRSNTLAGWEGGKCQAAATSLVSRLRLSFIRHVAVSVVPNLARKTTQIFQKFQKRSCTGLLHDSCGESMRPGMSVIWQRIHAIGTTSCRTLQCSRLCSAPEDIVLPRQHVAKRSTPPEHHRASRVLWSPPPATTTTCLGDIGLLPA